MYSLCRCGLDLRAQRLMSVCCKRFVTFLAEPFHCVLGQFLDNYLTSPALSPGCSSVQRLAGGKMLERLQLQPIAVEAVLRNESTRPLLRRPHVKTLESLVYSLQSSTDHYRASGAPAIPLILFAVWLVARLGLPGVAPPNVFGPFGIKTQLTQFYCT